MLRMSPGLVRMLLQPRLHLPMVLHYRDVGFQHLDERCDCSDPRSGWFHDSSAYQAVLIALPRRC